MFGGALKVVEKYWEAGPGSVCLICCGIGHDRQGSCGQKPAKCTVGSSLTRSLFVMSTLFVMYSHL